MDPAKADFAFGHDPIVFDAATQGLQRLSPDRSYEVLQSRLDPKLPGLELTME